MEYRRRKSYHSRRRDKSGGGVLVVLLLTVFLLAVAIAFSPLGDRILEQSCIPFLNRAEKVEDPDAAEDVFSEYTSPLPSQQPTLVSETVVLTVTAEPYYLLQMGVFDSVQEAQIFAAQLRSMGGAGFLLTDGGKARVFAAAYRDLESINTVIRQVREDGFEASGYPTDAMCVRVTLKGDDAALAVGQDSVSCLSEIPNALCELAIRFDAEGLTTSLGLSEIKELLTRCENVVDALRSCEDESLDRIRMILEGYQNALSTFLKDCANMDKELLSAELKALQIELILQYLSFFQN